MSVRIHNVVLRAVLEEFYFHFTQGGRVLWASEGEVPAIANKSDLDLLGVSTVRASNLPSVIIDDSVRRRILLVDVADIAGLMTKRRRSFLNDAFRKCQPQLILVNAFRSRNQFRTLLDEFPWTTVVWFAEEPGHLVHF